MPLSSWFTWDVLLSCFVTTSAFLYFIKSGKKAIIFSALSLYIGYGLSFSANAILENNPYSIYPLAVFLIGAAFSAKILNKFVRIKNNSLSLIPTILFSLLVSGAFLSMFFSILGANELIPAASFIKNILTKPAVQIGWLALLLLSLRAIKA